MSARGWAIFGAIGLVLGMAAGLLYGWVISPVQYVDTAPASLRADYKAEYALMVAEAYAREGDLDRARATLSTLGLPAPADYVAGLVETVDRDSTRQPLARLARDLGSNSQSLEPYLP